MIVDTARKAPTVFATSFASGIVTDGIVVGNISPTGENV
jgi:hypothetical protein